MVRKKHPVRVFLLVFVAVIVVVAAIAFAKVTQFQGMMAQAAGFKMPPTAVTSIVVAEETWQPVLPAVGSAQAVNGVIVTTDLPGLVDEISFESGQSVKEGDVLVTLDTKQEEAQIRSVEARLQLAKINLDRQKDLLQKRVAAQADYDSATAEFKQATANLEEIKALIGRKTIRAPFSGELGIRQVNLGQYLQSGDPVVPLQSIDPIYVNFSVPQQRLADLKTGQDVRVHPDGLPENFVTGKITSINSVVDEATRNVLVQATLANPDRRLRPGMFANVEVVLPQQNKVLALPASSINYAPYGDSVFVIEEMKDANGETYKGVRQQIVKLGDRRGDQVSILSGLKVGEEIVTSGGFKLHNGASVLVNNEVQPSNDPAPTPADS